MLKCIACGFEQPTGKFCSDCGTKFGETNAIHNTRRTLPSPTEPNPHLEKLKMQAKAYRSYFLRQLKKPALAYEQGENGLANGLTSILLLGILVTLSLFAALRPSLANGFLSFFGGAFIFTLFAITIALIALFATTSSLGPQQSIKTILSLYGAYLPPLLIGATVSFLLMVIKSYTYGHLLLSLVFLFAILLVPLYLLSALILKNPTTIDPFYIFIVYLITYSILFSLFIILIADSAIGGYFSELLYWFV